MNVEEAEETLAEAELVACVEGPLVDIKELRETCLGAGIPVAIGRQDACCGSGGGCGCGPKLRLLARPEDSTRVARLLQSRWRELALREGTIDEAHPAVAVTDDDAEPPCPACGTRAPLQDGACADCGLQLA